MCFTSQILLLCSFRICLSMAVAESVKSGQSQKIREFKTWSAENREHGSKSRKLRENKLQVFYWSTGHSFIGGDALIIMSLRKRKRLSRHRLLVFLFSFFLLVTFSGRTSKKLFSERYLESVWPRSDSFLGHTKMYFRKYYSTSCYSRRVWHMTQLMHGNQHSKHTK